MPQPKKKNRRLSLAVMLSCNLGFKMVRERRKQNEIKAGQKKKIMSKEILRLDVTIEKYREAKREKERKRVIEKEREREKLKKERERVGETDGKTKMDICINRVEY